MISMTEKVARELCEINGCDPDGKEPGDYPHCDGRGYGTEQPGDYLEPWHWNWREYIEDARRLIRTVRRG